MLSTAHLRLVTPSPRSTILSSAFGRSALVTTACTPSIASAADVSIDLMRAWACGLRKTAPQIILGNLMSAPYNARPVTLSRPSWRIGRVPITLYSLLGSNVATMVGSPCLI